MATLTLRAEQALLGAMLADPGLVHAVRRYLRPGNFISGRNREVFTACDAVRTAKAASPESWRARVAATAAEAGIPGWYLTTLETACPEPAHGRAYGALVMQAVARREMAASASEFARSSAAMRENVSRLVRADGSGGLRLGELARHATAVTDALRINALVFDPDITRMPAGTAVASRGRARDEELVLAALLRRHPQTEQVLQLPLDGAFTSRDRQSVFRAVRTLYVNGRDIDELTVDWESARHASEETPPRRNETPPRDIAPSYATRLAAIDTGPGEILSRASSLLGRTSAARRDRRAAAGTVRPGLRLVQPPPDMPRQGQGPAPRI